MSRYDRDVIHDAEPPAPPEEPEPESATKKPAAKATKSD